LTPTSGTSNILLEQNEFRSGLKANYSPELPSKVSTQPFNEENPNENREREQRVLFFQGAEKRNSVHTEKLTDGASSPPKPKMIKPYP
jgi:hypothetical protein